MSTDDSTGLLHWAPLRLKSPYLTFINNYYSPSWRTRHPITKEEEALRNLQLPRGVPFAVVCGACFQRSGVAANLTVSVSGHEYHSVPKTHSNRKTKYHVGYLECMMTYVITAPIETDGTITCTLNRGRQIKTEVISFGVVDVSIDEAPEELEIQNTEQKITLHCPSPDEMPSSSNPLVHVWHEDQEVSQSNHLIPHMKPVVSIMRSKHTKHIICSVYSIGKPNKVYRTRYQIIGSQAIAKQEYHISYDPGHQDYTDEFTPKKKLSNSVIGIIITAAIICALLTVVGIYRFVTAARRK